LRIVIVGFGQPGYPRVLDRSEEQPVKILAVVRITFTAFVWTCMFFVMPARAVIVLGGRDATGALNNSGQNVNPAPSNLSSYVGTWGGYLGTPIAPQYFITANHVGNGGGGGSFIYNDGGATPITYTATLAGVQDDLAIWKLSSGQFTHFAPVYTGSNEVGMSLIDIGRGTPRGTVVNTPSTSTPAGCNWLFPNPRAITWGANSVSSIMTVMPTMPGFGGDFLKWAFTINGNPDTGILSDGDSGGPTFVFDTNTSQYELAGINSLVDEVSTQSDPNGNFLLAAALYNTNGFYNGTTQISDGNPFILNSYSTRISSRLDFIDSVTGLPEPGTFGLASMFGFIGLYRRRLR
jgi:hypothetical protein